MIDLTEFNLNVVKTCEQYPHWRYGQILYNVLYDMYPDIAISIRGTDIDPFYFDKNYEKISKFYGHLLKNSS